MTKQSGFIAMLFFTMLLASTSGPIIPAQAAPANIAIKRQQSRNKYIKYEPVIDALGVSTGLTILDIGAGTGYSSYLFAEKLQGSGAVFATDISKEFVDYIAVEAKRRNLTNLHSALVKEEGLDDFYTKHRYDLVFASFVYHRIENPIDFFGKLRKFLNPGARLVVILYNQAPLFTVDELSNIDGLINMFSAEDKDNQLFEHLSNSTKVLLKDKTKKDEIANAFVDDFNRMLMNPRLYVDLYPRSKEPDKPKHLRMKNMDVNAREFANWLFMTLKEDGVFEKHVNQIEPKEMRTVIKLNRLFFQQLLGNYLINKGMGAYIPGGDASRNTNKYEALLQLTAAGYRFVREMRTSPYFDTIVMEPVTAAGDWPSAEQGPSVTGAAPP